MRVEVAPPLPELIDRAVSKFSVLQIPERLLFGIVHYPDYKISKHLHAAIDYQFIDNPAFNRARGPVSVFGTRLHWEF